MLTSPCWWLSCQFSLGRESFSNLGSFIVLFIPFSFFSLTLSQICFNPSFLLTHVCAPSFSFSSVSSVTCFSCPLFVSSRPCHPVTSEMDGKTSSGFSSTIWAPTCPPLPEPPDPSLPSSLLRTHTRPPSTSQQARPSTYAYTLPAFTPAHPPALPKIFQPRAGSGICVFWFRLFS